MVVSVIIIDRCEVDEFEPLDFLLFGNEDLDVNLLRGQIMLIFYSVIFLLICCDVFDPALAHSLLTISLQL